MSLPFDVLCNCVLVSTKARNAFLIQCVDYNEYTITEKRTGNIIETIKAMFPSLIFSVISPDQIIISTKPYFHYNTLSSIEIGEIIDYPYSCDLNITSNKCVIEILVDKIGSLDSFQIMGFMCPNLSYLDKTEDLMNKFREVLIDHPFTKDLFKSIYINTESIIEHDIIINKLCSNKKLTESEYNNMMNYVYNLGFEQLESHQLWDISNPVHRGMLISLLCYSKYDPLTPFFPLQRNPKEAAEVTKITEQLEQVLIDCIKK